MDLKGWSVPTWSQELPCEISGVRIRFQSLQIFSRSNVSVDCFSILLTAGSCGLTPRRHRTSPLSLRAQTGTCSILLWAKHGIREMSLRQMGGTWSHGLLTVILHFLWTCHCYDVPQNQQPQKCKRVYLVHLLRLTKSFMVLWP